MMRVMSHLRFASKQSKRIGIGISSHVISPGFAASSFCVVPDRVCLYDKKKFPPGSSGCFDSAPYEIFSHSKSDALPQHVYHGRYCGLPATIHYFESSEFKDVSKWLCIQEDCNAGYVLSIKAVYTTPGGPTIVFTERVKSLLSSWVTKMKVEGTPLIEPTGYIPPFLCSVYRDVVMSIMHVLNYSNDCHGNVSMDNIWLRDGSTVLGCPKHIETEVKDECPTDTEMFEHVLDSIHDDVLPKELEFFCRILHYDVAVMLSLLVLSPFLKTHTENMRNRFLAVRVFFDSTDSATRNIAVQIYKGHWDSLFANEAECAVMWQAKVIAHNPISTVRDHLVAKTPMNYVVKFVVAKGMVDGHPIHFLICVRNCAEHGTHMESEEYFDLLASKDWPAHWSMLSYLISLHHLEPFLSLFTAFTVKGDCFVIDASEYAMKERREWKADKAKKN